MTRSTVILEVPCIVTNMSYATITVIIRFDNSVMTSRLINYDLAFDNPFISETYKIICLWSYILDYTDITGKMHFFR